MVEYLAFQLCKPDGDSRYIKIHKEDGSLHMEIAAGMRGMYISDNIVKYRCGGVSENLISELIQPTKPYTWPRVIPSDYNPGEHILGCDIDSWSLDYKEEEKKTMRHIRGKGDVPEEEPYILFLVNLMRFVPDREVVDWFLER